MAKSKKKVGKTIGIVVLVLLAVLIIGFGIFLYFHGNTKPYDVPQEVSAAIQDQAVDKGDGEVRIMSSNLLVSYPSWHSQASRDKGIPNARPRAKIYYEVLDTYKPDVVGLQEMCDMWYNCLLRHDGPYKFAFPVSTAFTVRLTSLMYNSDTTDLIEKGQFAYSVGDNARLRRVVWGLFEDKATKERYIVTSTHLSVPDKGESHREDMKVQAKELVDFSNELKAKYNVPIYHTGDFNTLNNIENWQELFPGKTPEELAKYDPEEIATNNAPFIYDYLNESLDDTVLIANETSFRGTTTATTPVYDHIFLNGDNEISRFVSISNPEMNTMSDHFSIFVDTKLA